VCLVSLVMSTCKSVVIVSNALLLSRRQQGSMFYLFPLIYRNYAQKNRKEWEVRGQEVVEGYLEKYNAATAEEKK